VWRADAFAFSPLSLPFIVLSIGLSVLVMTVVLTRGNRLIRVSILAVGVGAMPWALGNALTGSCTDPEVATSICRFWIGTISLLGPGLLMVILVLSGRLERHGVIVVIATTIAMATCVITWTTDLVVAQAWKTSWGFWTPQSGDLGSIQPAQLVLWGVAGIVLVRRGGASSLETERQQLQTRRMIAICTLGALGAVDTLLSHGVGVYPVSWIPGLGAVVLGLIGILKNDALLSRGFDRSAAWELGILIVFAAVVVVVVWGMSSHGYVDAVVTAAVVAPLFAAGQIGVVIARSRLASSDTDVGTGADLALEEYLDASKRFERDAQIADALSELLSRHTRATSVRIVGAGAGGGWKALIDAEDAAAVPVDARVRAWLVANRAPIQRGELPQQRLGGLRGPIEQLLSSLGASIVVPLVTRDDLVGAILADAPLGDRALSDTEASLFVSAAAATANAIVYLRLVREAEARAEVAREVEVAAAAQNARSPGETHTTYTGCEVITHYEPAAQFGGDWWASAEVPDGRVFVVIGDVTGHGVPAALVSSTVAGACETALRWWGGGLDALAMLHLLNQSVLDVGGEHYSMSCFVAIFDIDAGAVTFANAGHPFPYICREAGSGRATLASMVSRGTPLGTHEPVLSVATSQLQPDDVIVFYSDALVDSRNANGEPYGDRRFQRVLRNYVRGVGTRACEVIVDDARNHYGDEPIDDDVTLVVVRLGQR
jgi:serine phosphatase RsbU (regulator of sigma subunit)